MRRFIVTSSKFKGQAELFYTAGGILCKIDCTSTEMSAVTIDHFKKAVPATLAGLIDGKSFSNDTTIIEAEYEVTFDMFWNDYDKKINKARCTLLWNKLNKFEQIKAFNAVKDYSRYLKKESWRGKADPETYLRNQYWENEYK